MSTVTAVVTSPRTDLSRSTTQSSVSPPRPLSAVLERNCFPVTFLTIVLQTTLTAGFSPVKVYPHLLFWVWRRCVRRAPSGTDGVTAKVTLFVKILKTQRKTLKFCYNYIKVRIDVFVKYKQDCPTNCGVRMTVSFFHCGVTVDLRASARECIESSRRRGSREWFGNHR